MKRRGRIRLLAQLSITAGLGLTMPLADAADFRPVNVPGIHNAARARLSPIPGHVSVVIRPANWFDGDDVYDWSPVSGSSLIGHIPPTSQGNFAKGISADGHTVVGTDLAGGSVAFRWTPLGGRQRLGTLPEGSVESNAYAVSADGSVIAGLAARPLIGGYSPIRWTEATGMQALGDLPGFTSGGAAEGVSANGQFVVGTVGSPSEGQAFRWDAINGLIGLGDLPGRDVSSRSTGISDDGTVVTGAGSSVSFNSEAFRWTPATGMVGLGDLPGSWGSQGTHVSGDGSTILGWTSQGAFIWTQVAGMRKLSDVLVAGGAVNMSGWQLGEIMDVSYDGTRILGRGTKGLFLADLVAEPIAVPPEAMDDGPYGPSPGIAERMFVGENDTGFTEPVTVTVTTLPTKGTITEIGPPSLSNAMTITYVANIGAVGADSFVYEMTDSSSANDSATVSINITPIPDTDGDGVADELDNCRETANSDQADADEDGPGDACDNCPETANADQADIDTDGRGDVCDNCPETANADQADTDEDGLADACDNCTAVVNTLAGNVTGASPLVARYQLDSDSDGYGNACDADINNSGTTTTADYAILRSVLGKSFSFSANAGKSDLNGSGFVTATDYAIMRALINLPPGPSGLTCAGTVPCP